MSKWMQDASPAMIVVITVLAIAFGPVTALIGAIMMVSFGGALLAGTKKAPLGALGVAMILIGGFGTLMWNAALHG